jgi:predicted  nucleic acid-binding Zn-ribbon protein
MYTSFKDIQESTIEQLKEINKTVQDLNVEKEAVKKRQTKEMLEMENLRKRTGTIDSSITNIIQEMEGRILGIEDTIEEIDNQLKKRSNLKNS